jgi:hypothetical protein
MNMIERMALAYWGAPFSVERDKRVVMDKMRAALAALQETHAVVPREPTEEFLKLKCGGDDTPTGQMIRQMKRENYEDMIAAAEADDG